MHPSKKITQHTKFITEVTIIETEIPHLSIINPPIIAVIIPGNAFENLNFFKEMKLN